MRRRQGLDATRTTAPVKDLMAFVIRGHFEAQEIINYLERKLQVGDWHSKSKSKRHNSARRLGTEVNYWHWHESIHATRERIESTI